MQQRAPGPTRGATAAALALFALAAALMLLVATRSGLWPDETFSLAMASGHSLEHPAAAAQAERGDYREHLAPVPPARYADMLRPEAGTGAAEVVGAVHRSDTSPPLYYLALSGWLQAVGASDLALRGFSVLWALAAFPLIGALAAQLGGRRAALPALLLYAVSPIAVYYATEGRMYSLLWFLTTACAYVALRLHQRGARPHLIASWTLLGAAGLLTHYFFLFPWAAMAVWLAHTPGRASRAPLALATAVSGLLALPWYAEIPATLTQWRVTAGWLEMQPGDYEPLTATLGLPWSYLSVRGPWGVRPLWDRLFALVFVALALLAVGRARRRGGARRLAGPRGRLLAAWFLAPCLGLVAFDLLQGTYAKAQARYLLAGLPAAVIGVACLLALVGRRARALALALMVFGCVVGLSRIARNDTRGGAGFRQAAQMVVRHAGPDDLVVVRSIPSGVLAVARYLEQLRAPAGLGLASWVEQLGEREVPADIARLAEGRRRLFLVTGHTVGVASPLEGWLEERADADAPVRFHHVQVRLFRLPETLAAPAQGGAAPAARASTPPDEEQ